MSGRGLILHLTWLPDTVLVGHPAWSSLSRTRHLWISLKFTNWQEKSRRLSTCSYLTPHHLLFQIHVTSTESSVWNIQTEENASTCSNYLQPDLGPITVSTEFLWLNFDSRRIFAVQSLSPHSQIVIIDPEDQLIQSRWSYWTFPHLPSGLLQPGNGFRTCEWILLSDERAVSMGWTET